MIQEVDFAAVDKNAQQMHEYMPQEESKIKESIIKVVLNSNINFLYFHILSHFT